jgi:formylglycine-generating enzyme required for sulfatase activity
MSGHDDSEILPIDFEPTPLPDPRAGRPRLGRRNLALGGAGIVAVLLALFTLSAVSVEIEVTPPVEVVNLPGTWFEIPFGEHILVRPGEHRVRAELEGYYPLDESIEVGSEPSQTFAFQLVKLPGLLDLITTPVEGAEVLIDGEPVGTTPLVAAEIRPGVHALEVRAERHLPHRDEIEIEGMGAAHSLEVALIPAWAPVSVSTDPSGARIRVDGVDVGDAPGTFEIGQGRRQVEAVLEGYKTWSSLLRVEAGVAQTLPEIVLAPAGGRLTLRSRPEGAQITVGDLFPGRTPLSFEIDSNRDHEVTLFKAGYELTTRSVRLAPGEERTLEVALDPLVGVVQVVVEPRDAILSVNGRPMGPANQRLELLAVPHELEIRKPGYATRIVKITPASGLPQRVEVRLVTLAEHRRVATPKEITTGAGQKLVRIDAGRFLMGTARGVPGRRANETRRPVELTQPFFLGAREVTNREFREFRPDFHAAGFNGHGLDDNDQPVSGISWEDAARYCNWLSQRDGLPAVYVERGSSLAAIQPLPIGYRLPTEAEWVWAVRYSGGKDERRYAWGDRTTPPSGAGNYADLSASGILPNAMKGYEDGSAVAASVGSGRPNPLGISNLGGNVAEWIHDLYTIHPPTRSETPVKDPTGPVMGQSHVIRGASWMNTGLPRLRVAYRDYAVAGRQDVGFRIARSAE